MKKISFAAFTVALALALVSAAKSGEDMEARAMRMDVKRGKREYMERVEFGTRVMRGNESRSRAAANICSGFGERLDDLEHARV